MVLRQPTGRRSPEGGRFCGWELRQCQTKSSPSDGRVSGTFLSRRHRRRVWLPACGRSIAPCSAALKGWNTRSWPRQRASLSALGGQQRQDREHGPIPWCRRGCAVLAERTETGRSANGPKAAYPQLAPSWSTSFCYENTSELKSGSDDSISGLTRPVPLHSPECPTRS